MLPSSTVSTFKVLPISRTSTSLPLNENEDVAAATFKFSIRLSACTSSSAKPTQKYSLAGSEVRFRNGKTASDDAASVEVLGAAGAIGWAPEKKMVFAS